MVKNRPKEQPSKTKSVTLEPCRLPGTLAGTQNRYWLTIRFRVGIENPTMALQMDDFSLNFSALPLETIRKGSVHDGLGSTESQNSVESGCNKKERDGS